MWPYIVRRVLQILPVLLIVTFLVYGLMLAIPGDPVYALVGPGEVLDEEQLEVVPGALAELEVGDTALTVDDEHIEVPEATQRAELIDAQVVEDVGRRVDARPRVARREIVALVPRIPSRHVEKLRGLADRPAKEPKVAGMGVAVPLQHLVDAVIRFDCDQPARVSCHLT